MRPVKILLTGATGQLGHELINRLRRLSMDVLGLSHGELDINDVDGATRYFSKFSPDLLINCAAYTKVDAAESEIEAAYRANARGPGILAGVCREQNIPMFHLSTDFVYDGQKTSPYLETDPIHPLSIYGNSKAMGEAEIIKSLREHIIIRTSWLYGTHGKNFVKTIMALAIKKQPLKVVDDQIGSPTSAADLADAIVQMILKYDQFTDDCWGIYHYAGKGVVSWYQFAKAILFLLEKEGKIEPPEIIPVKTSEYPAIAERPSFSALDCTKIGRVFGIEAMPWEKSLSKVVLQLLHDLK